MSCRIQSFPIKGIVQKPLRRSCLTQRRKSTPVNPVQQSGFETGEHFEKALVAVQYRYKQDGRLSQELSTLLPLVPAFLPAGWLGRLVRTLVNAGFYPQTRSA